ncbi:hypothetical protein EV361DRAFT_916148 [Lentinula raphanica]|uniref:BZIP domain-containing protein n=1 Tax=Lentinula raphanica TaxID=153919 RepID=A0AA38PD75_9AGAR|nr:hypothetical protein C8R42DRAFT_679312 [Lentinula raphanica]KAJ3756305.1 hypothetical protein EV360DRAFT_72106 [Lentinula raphanica]KAJ3770812.1 hypothetical protein FB446DRAFT_742758 [Lentinula raphanica]KAJ3828229.1 hypothetical protein F5880DRAFT_989355 [Lentinula raphanica]KAJ3840739.1 hypothetical protein F5878DRAFT_708587 [Lentinula raphanica]
MSSKRGRKRNDNLPPNRARDVQRAFRARRAAHLQALEQRVSELEEENSCLRQALSLPPANRPVLGKGPTGKDKPKAYNTHSLTAMALKSRDSSDSPPSTRMSSHSPESSIVRLDDPVWDQTIVMNDTPSDLASSSSSSSYPSMHPMSAPPSSKSSMQYNPYPPTSSRSSSGSGSVYMNSPSPYPHSHPHSSTYPSSDFSAMRLNPREDSRTHYSYSPAPYDGSLQNNTPPSAPPHIHSQRDQASISYPRRQMNEPYTVGPGISHFPTPMTHHTIHLSSPPQVHDNTVHSHLSQGARHVYNNTPDTIVRTPSMS